MFMDVGGGVGYKGDKDQYQDKDREEYGGSKPELDFGLISNSRFVLNFDIYYSNYPSKYPSS